MAFKKLDLDWRSGKSGSCSNCNDTGVKSWGETNASGRNDNIVYCTCDAGKKAAK